MVFERDSIESNTVSPDLKVGKVSKGDFFISEPGKSLTLRKIDPLNRKYSGQELLNVGSRCFWILEHLWNISQIQTSENYISLNLKKLRHLLNGRSWISNPILDEKARHLFIIKNSHKEKYPPTNAIMSADSSWICVLSTKSCSAIIFICFVVNFLPILYHVFTKDLDST